METKVAHPGIVGLTILKLGTLLQGAFLRLPPSSTHHGLRISTAGSRYPGYARHRIVEALDCLADFAPASLDGLRSFFDGILIEPRTNGRFMEGTPFRVLRIRDAPITRHDVTSENTAAYLAMELAMRRELGFRSLAAHPRRREIELIGAMAFRDFAGRVPGAEALVHDADAEIERLAGADATDRTPD